MTTPQLKASVPPGGLQTQDVDKDYSDRVAGRPLKRRVAYVELVAVKTSEGDTDKGRKQRVIYEVVRLIPVQDANEQDNVRHRIAEIERARGIHAEQFVLFPDDGEDPKVERARLLGYIDEWAAEQEPPLDREAVTERWVSWHGGFYNAQLDKAEVPHLREWCLTVGVLAEDGTQAVAGEDEGDDPDAAPHGPEFSG